MRSLPKSFLPILIALALLQSVARSASALPPNPSDRHRAAHSQESGARDKQSATAQPCPAVTVVVQQIPPKEAQRITAVIQEQPYKHWWEAPYAPEWALFILTIPYVIISAGLFRVSWKAANAAKESADAALATAEATKLALAADRPFLMAEEPDIDPLSCDVLICATLHFRNRGKGPAIIDRLAFSLEPAPDEPDFHTLIATANPEKQIIEVVIGPAEKSSHYIVYCYSEVRPIRTKSGAIDIHSPLVKLLLDKKERLTLSGFVEYHDTSGNPHITEFVWRYMPVGAGTLSSDYNRQT
jgi:hypothetical protein